MCPGEAAKRQGVILWLEDDLDVISEIQGFLRTQFRLDMFVADSLRELVGFLENYLQHATENPLVAFLLARELPDRQEFWDVVARVQPRAVISDLQMANDPLAGFSVLSVVSEVAPKAYRALFTARSDQSVVRLARAMGICAVIEKGSGYEGVVRLLAEALPEAVGGVERARDLDEAIGKLERENRRLRAQLRRLKRQAPVSRAKTARPARPTAADRAKGDKIPDAPEERLRIILAQQHDLLNTAALAVQALDRVCSKPELIPPLIMHDLRSARIAAKHSAVLIQTADKLAAGPASGKPEPGSIARSFQEAYEIIARKIPDSVTVSIEVPDNLPPSRIPDSALVRCALNLLLNASEAIKDRGHIEVTTGTRPRRNAKHVDVLVRDNGEGIRKRDLGKAFDWGFSTRGKKQGFGLFIVKRIIEMHGGRVAIDSKRGKGTTVSLKIPLA